jgi:predicted RND superfamily exporter protein
METIIIIGIIAFVAYFAYRVMFGKTAKEVISEINETVVKTADVNKDGKVNVDDAVIVAKEVKNTTKKVAAKVRTAVKKPKGVK